ncbi:hypothetical protein QUB70_17155 [Microcoleus sp. A003_D6]|uniref:hypothetical protein n=1 Tax=Microcoleus sp. A003_D6 TaxID=3055266 RepID=UPI002FD50F91
MTILNETLGYPPIGKNREVKKALKASSSGKLKTNSLLQTIPALQNIVKAAKILREEANAS